jgi:hypothetical protein
MTPERILEILGEEYQLIVRTTYHLQIAVQGGYHNLWITKEGLKVQFHGKREAEIVRLKELTDRLKKYNYADTDLAAIQSIKSVIAKAGKKKGIFCDAGFKDGKARICVIRIMEGQIDVRVKDVECKDNATAEWMAVQMAIGLYPGDETIHTDSKVLEEGRVKWIPRANNREADSFGNLRS